MSRDLEGLVSPRIDTDWLAVDRHGRIAFFAAGEQGPIPREAAPADTEEALEVEQAALRELAAAHGGEDAYRGAEQGLREPVFDAPSAADGTPSHEMPERDYPFLVVGSDPAIRNVGGEWSAHEALAREGYGMVFPALGPDSWGELHAGACQGCRVLDDPEDPRPRSPEALTAAGLYVYAHTGENRNLPYRRIASPSRPADLDDLEPILAQLASRVRLDTSFEEQSALPLDALAEC